MLILSTQLFSFPQNAKNMKEKKKRIFFCIFPFVLEGKNLSNFEKEKEFFFFGVAFPLGLF
jgi:hypothetical protein